MEQMQWLLGHNHDDAQSGQKSCYMDRSTHYQKIGCEDFKEKKLEQFLMNLFADMASCIW